MIVIDRLEGYGLRDLLGVSVTVTSSEEGAIVAADVQEDELTREVGREHLAETEGVDREAG